ncbi:uncharacterized protein B0H18DRAFT_1006841 [Fomitopsis serialis]|uniref:uncharacterized protein n=1 Tax=Fomitopsis serialis TaxID=139415 RepID=UPI002008C8AC|nr:uncharacterized protein B0H18DRAFT_1006841 [Neoantrodia serialis]KAH9926184.1 hypothetical protein B0H18DRAFT_1006841 [Neoantrodia serialis]
MMNKLPLSGSEIEEFFARASEEDAYDLLCNSIPTHHNAYDEEQEAARPFLPLGTPPEATLGLHPSALVETVDRKLKELNDQRLAISRSICEYKRLRNSAARLLVKVFLYAPERILAVSQVSAEWRARARATPRLWTDIPLRQRQLAELFLARSGDACVRYQIRELALSAAYPRLEDLQRVLLLGRLKSLHVELGDVRELQLLLEALGGPAPHLEEIQLRFTEPDLSWLMGPADTLSRPTLFDDVTPRLRVLVLDSIDVYWTSGVFANLTKLDVGRQLRHLHPDVDDFLDILERCPLLEQLSYRCWIPNFNIDRLQPYSGPAPRRRQSRYRSCHESGHVDFPLDMLPPDTSRIPALSNIRSLDIEPALPHQLNLHLGPNAFKGWIWSRPLSCTLRLLGCDFVSFVYRDVFQKLDIRRLESLTIRDLEVIWTTAESSRISGRSTCAWPRIFGICA